MKKLALFSLVAILVASLVSCDKDKVKKESSDTPSEPTTPSYLIKDIVKDYDGNSYDGIKCTGRIVLAQNLRTTHYADGTEIPMGTNLSYEGCRYNPNDNSENVNKYGYLYNWTAATHGDTTGIDGSTKIQGICPDGWHLPSWSELYTIGFTYEDYRPALSGRFDGGYSDFNKYAYLWTSDADMGKLKGVAIQYKFSESSTQTSAKNYPMQDAFGVRCIKNE